MIGPQGIWRHETTKYLLQELSELHVRRAARRSLQASGYLLMLASRRRAANLEGEMQAAPSSRLSLSIMALEFITGDFGLGPMAAA